jgi:hypothetical protein
MRADQILPEHVNEVKLEGTRVRKGTVAAFLANARVLMDANASPSARQEAERDIIEALPALRALGVFEVVEVRDKKLKAFIDAH